jgi:hypothetical protein
VRLGGLASSLRLAGRSRREKLVVLARLLGRLLSLLSRPATGPNDKRLMPDVDNLLTCFMDPGVSSATDDVPLAVLPPVRFLLLMVTLGGM